MGHGESLNRAIGRAKARQIRATESGDRPGWRNERGAKARERVTGKASLQNAELAACREAGEHCSPTAREGDIKKQREWGKDCFLQTWCDLLLKKTGFPF